MSVVESERIEEEEEETESKRKRREMDPEIWAMSALLRALDGLEEPAKARAVGWLHARYVASYVAGK